MIRQATNIFYMLNCGRRTITLEDKDMVPCFGVSAREVAGTVIKDMKMYVAPDQEQQDTTCDLFTSWGAGPVNE